MTISKNVVSFILGATALLAIRPPDGIDACSCIFPSVEDEYEQSDLVFKGTMTGLEHYQTDELGFLLDRWNVTFDIVTCWKCPIHEPSSHHSHSVTLVQPTDSECGYNFPDNIGSEWIVFANGFASNCGHTSPFKSPKPGMKHPLIAALENITPGKNYEHNYYRSFGGGDPHFKTWNGQFFSYQGECDLVLIKSPAFGTGLGLDLHIRTKQRSWWSFIQSVAIRIGTDTLEVASDQTHFLNGMLNAKLPSKIGGYKVSKIVEDSPFSIVYVVNLGEGQTIKIKRGKRRMLSVDVSQHEKTFHDSVGLMGTWKKKGLIARDGVTNLLNDQDAYGREWQVLDSEKMLFQTRRAPQYPEVCAEVNNMNRRLEEMPERIPMALVEKACSHVEDANRDFCIYDVMAMGDLSVAESPFYNE